MRGGTLVRVGAALVLAVLIARLGLPGTGSKSADLSRPVPPVPQGAGDLVLAVVGTSLTARSAWPEAVAERLARCSGRDVRLRRFARPGANSDWGLSQVSAVAAARPGLVLIEFTINDADLRDGVSLRRSAENHRGLIAVVRQEVPEVSVALVSLNPPRGWRWLTRPLLGRYRAVYAELAATESTGFVDLDPLWRAALAEGGGAALLPDGLHPAPAAVARLVTPAMMAAVGPAVSPGC